MLDFNECKESDFKKWGLNKKPRQYRASNLMVCPDFEIFPDLIKVFNEYSNFNRDDVSIEIETCDQS